MVLSSVTLYRYELPLTAPLQLGDTAKSVRRGLLVRLETDEGTVGWGEAAPLPGFSPESLSEAVTAARAAAPEWGGAVVPHGQEASLDDVLGALAGATDVPASLQFATESAVAMLLAATRTTDVASVLGDPRPTVALNALISSPLEDGPAKAARYRNQGYRAVKVKVGRGAFDREVEALREIRRALGTGPALRADTNRAWSFEQALAFAKATRDLSLAYVEEPLADRERLPELMAQTALPIALDETTREATPTLLNALPAVEAVVLKPTLLGGLRATMKWRRAAEAVGAVSVLSSSYESGLGLRMLVALAATGPDAPAGLSTARRLADDVVQPPFESGGPTVSVASVSRPKITLNDARLDLIDSFSSGERR